MLNNIEERRLGKKFNAKVREFPGADIQDMYHFISPLLKRSPKYLILHIGCNDAVNKKSVDIFNEILELKAHIISVLPNVKVFISCPVLRSDNAKASLTITRLRSMILNLGEDIIIHENIDSSCLGKAGLHLNAKGTGRLAMNFISLMRQL